MSLRIVRIWGRRWLAFAWVLAFSILATSCTRSPSPGGPDASITVVASFYPLAEAAQQVGGDAVRVINLTAPGVEPHDLELTPEQIEEITTADVVVYLGGGFQPAVEDAVADARGRLIDASSGLRNLPVPNSEESPGLEFDPHIWLDPVLYSEIVGRVEKALAGVDPPAASSFAANADAFMGRLRELDGRYRARLQACPRNLIVTSHAAFGYLARRYGLQQEAITGLSPEAEPSPQRLADLKALVENTGVTTIFTEELVSPAVAETLASETGATTAVLSPLESLTPDEVAAGQDYVSVMDQNLRTLGQALGCS